MLFSTRSVMIAVLFASLVGCTNTPNKGRGGLGEYHVQSSFTPVMPDEPLGPEHGLRFDWQLAKLHLDALIREGARWCFPAAVVQAIEKQNRIARELEGGLLLDAANDIAIQRKRLNKLEQQLDYVTSQTRCVPPLDNNAFEKRLSMVDKLYQLLNHDNQFAFNSTEVNPKYMGHLARAAHLLIQHSSLNLKVTGHADSVGSAEHNQTLAMERARQVKRYLIIFGLSPKRIETQSVGDTLPLHKGESQGVKLTNRRVSIEVVDTKRINLTHLSGGEHEMD